MKVGFIGCPSSGKTTLAAMLFARLKDDGLVVEFLAEEARRYIAMKKMEPGEFCLTKEDQIAIMNDQINMEWVFNHKQVKENILISDSSWANAFGYMDYDKLSDVPSVSGNTRIQPYDVLFYTPPIPYVGSIDPNRVHSYEQAVLVDSRLKKLVFGYGVEGVPLCDKLIPLNYTESRSRFSYALSELLDIFFSYV